jgi:hypothetical protein
MRQYEILIGFLLATALWATVIVLKSDASLLHQICETNQYTEHETCTPHHSLYVALYYIGYAINPVTVGAAATVAIAVFTYTLYAATNGLVRAAEIQSNDMKRSIAVGEIAANAAKATAESAVATERARLYVVIEHNFLNCINSAAAYINTPTVDGNPLVASNLPVAKFNFRNYGKTPGILIEVGSGIEYSETVPIPVYAVKVVRDNIVAYEQSTEDFTEVVSGIQMTMGEAKKVRSGEGHIWIFGYAIYDDIFGERHTHRFFQRLVSVDVDRCRFVLQSYDHKHYNRST